MQSDGPDDLAPCCRWCMAGSRPQRGRGLIPTVIVEYTGSSLDGPYTARSGTPCSGDPRPRLPSPGTACAVPTWKTTRHRCRCRLCLKGSLASLYSLTGAPGIWTGTAAGGAVIANQPHAARDPVCCAVIVRPQGTVSPADRPSPSTQKEEVGWTSQHSRAGLGGGPRLDQAAWQGHKPPVHQGCGVGWEAEGEDTC